ncbi:mannosyltransferase putative-domain-containing protein [Elsinoe ampelina]|uniref:Mannosyltransferase putative-domain-containing protein n=1 Tax=Elsinoe ampelina TaxID=302913 RepID=A0A6A6FYU3_9PEZI|nr:mannosyltransferase putative-domain-containing protein [Elsinoe ampelina]
MSKLEPQSPSFPFKEDMYKFYAKRRRQPRWVRVLIAVLIVSFIYLVVINTGNPAGWASEDVVKPRTAPRSRIAEELGLDTHSRAKTDQVPLNDEPRRPTKEASKGVEEDEETEHEERSRTKASKPKEKEIEVKDEVSKKLESDLKHVFAIMPDELHLRELLRPIENSGKERLRELGLRARAFRTFLEAWEEIHFVHGKKTITIRDDIVNYLSKVKDLSAISHSKGRAEIIRSYEGFRYFLTKMSDLLFPFTAPYFADHMSLHASIRYGGRGIVLSGGDGQLSYMLTSVKALRKLGCNLPVEIMYLGDDDLGDDSRSELEALPGVITRDMEQMVRDEGWQLKGWAGKPFAILLSSFREAIFIDADAQFFVTPEVLFEDEAYEENGALFFRDRLMFPESKRKWLQQILPKPMSRKVRHSRFWTGESGHMQESGVVVVDKWRHFMALLFVTRMNGPDRDGDKDKGIVGTYDMVYGDKETFWLGWELVGDSDYAFHPGNAGNMGVAYEDIKDALKGIATSDDSQETPIEDEAETTKAEEPEKSLDDAKPAESVKDQKEAEVAKEKAELEGKPAAEGAVKDEAADPAAAPAAEGPLGDKPAAAVEEKPKARVKRATVPRRDDSDGEVNALGGSLNNDADLSTGTEPTKNYTICAPQLLHLDRKGRPLWFNGWIMDNKFDADHAKLSKFEVYMSEMKHGATEADWRLEQNNMCCLISDKIHKFTKQERLTLKHIVKLAEDSGALGKHRG